MEDLSGKQLGAYRVDSSLGQGGMAAVYKAFHPATDRFVALKILPQEIASDTQFMARFRQEAKVVARLQHPHILPVFDFGESEGYTYLVMPLVTGGTLAQLLNGQPLPLSQLWRVTTQIGDALDYAHSQGVIHRDVKPSNVLLDERGNCLLTDFGLAKIMQGSAALTTAGGVMGTPAYISPEQGLGLTLDGRSDIYSLGVILYEMVTGRAPFLAETPMAVVVKHINDPLPPPRTLNPGLPEAVERVILKALEKNPADRYATACDLVLGLHSALPDMVMLASPPGSGALPPSSPLAEAASSPVPSPQAADSPGMLTSDTTPLLAPPSSLSASTVPLPPEPGTPVANVSDSKTPPRNLAPGSPGAGMKAPVTEPASPAGEAATPPPAETREAFEAARQAARRANFGVESPLPAGAAASVDASSTAGRRLWLFILLSAIGWGLAPLAGNWLEPYLASMLRGNGNLSWLLVAGGFSGLFLGAALRVSGESRVRAAHILLLGLIWALAAAGLQMGIWALGAMVMAGSACGLVARWVEPRLGGPQVLAIVGGWITSLFVGGLAFWLIIGYLEPRALSLAISMAVAGAGGSGIMAWQLHRASLAAPSAKAQLALAEAREPRPQSRVRLPQLGCLAWLIVVLGLAGYRGLRVVFPVSNCYKDLSFSTARYDAQLDEVVTAFSTSDKIIPVIENDAIWLTSCGSVWSQPPLPLIVKLVDSQNKVVGNRPCDSVFSPRTACPDNNPYHSLPPGRYQMQFLYGDLLVDTRALTVGSDPGYRPPSCDSQTLILGATLGPTGSSWLDWVRPPELRPLPKMVNFVTDRPLIPVIESYAVCTDPVVVSLLDSQQRQVHAQAGLVPLGQTQYENFNPVAGQLAAGHYTLELWYDSKRLQALPLILSSPGAPQP